MQHLQKQKRQNVIPNVFFSFNFFTTWKLFPESESDRHHVEEEEERHAGRQSRQHPAGRGAQLGVGV